MAGTAIRGRLTWQPVTAVQIFSETPRVRTIIVDLDGSGWPGHLPGQHVDVRLTAADGYQAERAYSIASAPGEPLALTVERLDDGEVSSYLAGELRPGDQFEIRGPIGGYFVWRGEGPLLLVAGGSGVVPFRAMLRERQRSGSDKQVRMLYSSRSWDEVIYRSELDAPQPGVQVVHTLTRSQPAGWAGYARRVDAAMLAGIAWPVSADPLAFVCGPTPFVERVASALTDLGYPPRRVRTERFGGTGGG
jgi:ferredoxin-NADP reductase